MPDLRPLRAGTSRCRSRYASWRRIATLGRIAPTGATRPTSGVGGRPAALQRSAPSSNGSTRKRAQRAMAGQKIRIRLKAYDHEVIDSSARKIVDTVVRTGASVAGPVPLPTEKNVYCVIRSPHKYKDSR